MGKQGSGCVVKSLVTFIRGAKRKMEPSLSLPLSGKEARARQRGKVRKGKGWSRLNPGRLTRKQRAAHAPPPPLTYMAKRLSLCRRQLINARLVTGWLGQFVFGHTHSKEKCARPSSSSSSRPASLETFLTSALPGLPWSQLHGFKNRTPPGLQPRESPNSSTISLNRKAQKVPIRRS